MTGWLPAEESDFVSDVTHKSAALWHVQFDTDEVRASRLELPNREIIANCSKKYSRKEEEKSCYFT